MERDKNEFLLSAEEKQAVWERIFEYADTHNVRLFHPFLHGDTEDCSVRKGRLTAYPNGNITPCDVLPNVILGNVHDPDFDIGKIEPKKWGCLKDFADPETWKPIKIRRKGI
jgi:MoaA/NifB/PqqE/SkfB family radical SAM enzyme